MRSLSCFLTVLALGSSALAATPKTPAGYVLQNVPLVKQPYNGCGPASITEVLGYFGLNVDVNDVSRWTRPDERSYMSAQAIVDFAPVVGMEARLYAYGNLNSVRSAIKNGLPIIALQSHIPEAGKVIPHWRVIVGYDDQRRAVYTMDPLLGYVAIGYDDFLRVWGEQRGQFAVMYPPKLSATVKKVLG